MKRSYINQRPKIEQLYDKLKKVLSKSQVLPHRYRSPRSIKPISKDLYLAAYNYLVKAILNGLLCMLDLPRTQKEMLRPFY
jgi:hypothetical protein